MLQQKVKEFFETHPENNIVFGALGLLFTEVEKANAYVGGTGKGVETFTRPAVVLDINELGEIGKAAAVVPENTGAVNTTEEVIENLDLALSQPPAELTIDADKVEDIVSDIPGDVVENEIAPGEGEQLPAQNEAEQLPPAIDAKAPAHKGKTTGKKK